MKAVRALRFLVPFCALAAAVKLPPIRSEDASASSGLAFVLDNNPTSRKYLVETMAGGVAALMLPLRRADLVDTGQAMQKRPEGRLGAGHVAQAAGSRGSRNHRHRRESTRAPYH